MKDHPDNAIGDFQNGCLHPGQQYLLLSGGKVVAQGLEEGGIEIA